MRPNSSRLSVIIPTMDSAHYIDLILEYYSSIGISTTVFVDSKTSDDTVTVAERYATVIPFDNAGATIEAVVEKLSTAGQSEFVLRLDDDELPSINMMKFVKAAIQVGAAEVYGFPRHQCAISTDRTLLTHIDHRARTHHRQWRLYCPAKVRFTGKCHTSGVDLAGLRCVSAPDDACMIHLDWALHGYEQRKAKIARYDAHTPGAGSYFRSYYLYEDVAGASERFRPCDLPEFRSTVRSVAERFPELCIKLKDQPLRPD
jgi:hypothetical protein